MGNGERESGEYVFRRVEVLLIVERLLRSLHILSACGREWSYRCRAASPPSACPRVAANGSKDGLLLQIDDGCNLPFRPSINRLHGRAPDGAGQIGGADHWAGIHGAASLNAVFQFTHIARPVVNHERFHGILA